MTERNPFMKYVQKIWNKPDDYVISYLKAANKVKFDNDIEFLITLRTIRWKGCQ